MIVPVKTDTWNYDIVLEPGAIKKAGELLNLNRRVLVVTDSGVPAQYAETVAAQCSEAVIVTIPQGEQSKCFDEFRHLLSEMLDKSFTRGDCVVAVGGGVVGDLSGFAASCYMRGVDFYNIPTTLLSQVDSSVGGKTAVDLPAGKNLVGAFCQPSLVLCDPHVLSTLPDPVFYDGCAEVIKAAMLKSHAFFEDLQKTPPREQLEHMLEFCISMKRDVVEEDEFDTGARMKLNLGHTVGHGVEAKSHFAISHGKAVAIGMAIVSRASACADTPRIVALLEQFGLPTRTDYSADDLFSYTLSDKKRSGGTVNLIIPRAIGDCAIVPPKVESLKSFIQAGL